MTEDELRAALNAQMFWTPKEIARLIGISEQKVYADIHKGALPAYGFGRTLRVKRPDLRAYIQQAERAFLASA